MGLLHLWLIFITFMVVITFMVDFYYIYGCYCIYGFYYIYGWYSVAIGLACRLVSPAFKLPPPLCGMGGF